MKTLDYIGILYSKGNPNYFNTKHPGWYLVVSFGGEYGASWILLEKQEI